MAAEYSVSKSVFGGKGDPIWSEMTAVVDLDGDGHKEVIVGFIGPHDQDISPKDPTPVIFSRSPDGTYTDQTLRFIPSGFDVLGMGNDALTADMNGDGRPDLFFVDHGRETVLGPSGFPGGLNHFYLSQLDGSWARATVPLGRSFWHASMNTADIDGDDDQDLVVATLSSYDGGRLISVLSNERGNLSDVSKEVLPSTWLESRGDGSNIAPGTAGFIDLYNDGIPDILTLPYTNEYPQWMNGSQGAILVNNGMGQFTREIRFDARPQSFPSQVGFPHFVVGDFDGNGFEDFIAVAEYASGGNQNGMHVVAMYQQLDGTLIDKTLDAFGAYFLVHPTKADKDHPSAKIAAYDVNRDGFLDVIWPHQRMVGPKFNDDILINDGTGRFKFASGGEALFSAVEVTGLGNGEYRPIYADLNSDGALDILVLSSDWNGGNPVIQVMAVVSALKFTHEGDHFVGGKGTRIDGGPGEDLVQYAGSLHEHRIIRIADGATKVIGRFGTDYLENVEKLTFADSVGTLRFDLTPTEKAVANIWMMILNRLPDYGTIKWQAGNVLAGHDTTPKIALGLLNSEEFKYWTQGFTSDQMAERILKGFFGEGKYTPGQVAGWGDYIDDVQAKMPEVDARQWMVAFLGETQQPGFNDTWADGYWFG